MIKVVVMMDDDDDNDDRLMATLKVVIMNQLIMFIFAVPVGDMLAFLLLLHHRPDYFQGHGVM